MSRAWKAPPAPRGSARAPSASLLAPPKDYEGIRLGPYKYIAWPDGEKELYDLEKDPYELNNLVRIPNYFPVRNFLHRELTERLEDCVGRGCREEASEIPLTRRERQQVIRAVKAERAEKRRNSGKNSTNGRAGVGGSPLNFFDGEWTAGAARCCRKSTSRGDHQHPLATDRHLAGSD